MFLILIVDGHRVAWDEEHLAAVDRLEEHIVDAGIEILHLGHHRVIHVVRVLEDLHVAVVLDLCVYINKLVSERDKSDNTT